VDAGGAAGVVDEDAGVEHGKGKPEATESPIFRIKMDQGMLSTPKRTANLMMITGST